MSSSDNNKDNNKKNEYEQLQMNVIDEKIEEVPQNKIENLDTDDVDKNESTDKTNNNDEKWKKEYENIKEYLDSTPVKRNRRRNIPTILVIIISLISGLIGGVIAIYMMPVISEDVLPYQPQKIEIVSKKTELDVTAAVAKKVMPAIVGIKTQVVQYDYFFGQRTGEQVGTGVIVDKNGYILTNSHVVNDGEYNSVMILLYDGESIEGEVLWNDSILDLAIVKIDKTNLLDAELGDSDQLDVGEMAIAIGNPLGFAFERTVTQGIISGLERSIQTNNGTIERLIQTDASINPGNSGGPLLNQYGEVIGINTAKIQSGEGLGFAIPINMAKPIVTEFKEKGEFKKSYLGIKGINVSAYISNFQNNLGVEQGVYVYQIYTDSPVAKAGLKEEDVILSIQDKEISTMTQLINELYKYRPGDKVTLGIFRDGKELKIEVTLDSMPLD